MTWSAVHDGKVYDVVVARTKPYQDVHLVRSGERIYLGTVMRVTCDITPNWWTFGDRPDFPAKAEGFVTRRYAIQHLLRKLGYWKDD